MVTKKPFYVENIKAIDTLHTYCWSQSSRLQILCCLFSNGLKSCIKMEAFSLISSVASFHFTIASRV